MMLHKVFASRKFTTAIVGALLVGLNDALDLGLKEETIRNIVMILTGWIVGESAIDAAALFGVGKTNGTQTLPPAPPPPSSQPR